MDFQFLETRIENDVLVVILSREEHLNSLTQGMIRELYQLFNSLEKDMPTIKGVVITGKGRKAFAAGADIKELSTLNPDESYVLSQEGHKTFHLIEHSRIPVVAAINGYALGGGFELALACHIRVADTTSQMGLPESTLGLIPGYGGTQRLTHIIGRAKAIEFMCSGEMIPATYAKDLGIVSYVTTPGIEVTKSINIIDKMTKNASSSVKKILEASLMNIYNPEDGHIFERKAFAELLHSENGREGMNAFLEKRKPEFK